jgi:hypothetical protein
MPSSIINSDDGVVSGTSGLKSSGGDDGVLVFQSKGTETARINTDKQIVAAAGTNSLPALTTTGDLNTGIYFPAADTIGFVEGGAEAMRIDSSGRVGIGDTTPAATLEVRPSGTTDSFFTDGIRVSRYTGDLQYGTITNNGGMVFTAVEAAIGTPVMQFRTSADGTTSTQRMIIDSSGNVGIGTTSPGERLVVSGGGLQVTGNLSTFDRPSSSVFDFFSGLTRIFSIGANSSTYGTLSYQRATTTGSIENFRVTSGGYFKASNTGTYANATGSFYELYTTTSGQNLAVLTNTSASPFGININFSGATPNNTTNYFLLCNDSTNEKCFIYSSGTVTNRTGTYNSISDLKLKQDIVDANSQWNDIKALRIVKYRLKDEVAADPNYPAYIGVIAQEVEQISPGLVDNCPDFESVTKTREVEKTREVTPAVLDEEGNEIEPAVTETYTEEEEYTEREATGTVTKSVKSSIIYMKAVKALQEAMERIETLEAKVAALESKE